MSSVCSVYRVEKIKKKNKKTNCTGRCVQTLHLYSAHTIFMSHHILISSYWTVGAAASVSLCWKKLSTSFRCFLLKQWVGIWRAQFGWFPSGRGYAQVKCKGGGCACVCVCRGKAAETQPAQPHPPKSPYRLYRKHIEEKLTPPLSVSLFFHILCCDN